MMGLASRKRRRASSSVRRLAASVVALACCGAPLAGALALGPAAQPPAGLEDARAALQKYQDPIAAVRDGYFSTLGCVHYAEGGMGVHFLNPALIGPTPDPLRPQILVYEPVEGGRLRHVAAEWFIPLATGITERPSLFGRPFDGPMEGHEPLIPRELHHYDLHVWLFKPNPAGMFNVTNPDVSCHGHGYALLEQPTASGPARPASAPLAPRCGATRSLALTPPERHERVGAGPPGGQATAVRQHPESMPGPVHAGRRPAVSCARHRRQSRRQASWESITISAV